MPMLEERQPLASHASGSGPQQPVIKQEPGLDVASLPQPMEDSKDLSATSTPGLPQFFDYSLMNGMNLLNSSYLPLRISRYSRLAL